MSKNWSYTSGDWWIQCDVCSKKIKASESKQRWDGFIVCSEDFETRHPQDFIRAKQDKISVPFSRPRSPDVFVHSCSIVTSSGRADIGTADCAMADYSPEFDWSMWRLEFCNTTESSNLAGVGVAGCLLPTVSTL